MRYILAKSSLSLQEAGRNYCLARSAQGLSQWKAHALKKRWSLAGLSWAARQTTVELSDAPPTSRHSTRQTSILQQTIAANDRVPIPSTTDQPLASSDETPVQQRWSVRMPTDGRRCRCSRTSSKLIPSQVAGCAERHVAKRSPFWRMTTKSFVCEFFCAAIQDRSGHLPLPTSW